MFCPHRGIAVVRDFARKCIACVTGAPPRTFAVDVPDIHLYEKRVRDAAIDECIKITMKRAERSANYDDSSDPELKAAARREWLIRSWEARDLANHFRWLKKDRQWRSWA